MKVSKKFKHLPGLLMLQACLLRRQ